MEQLDDTERNLLEKLFTEDDEKHGWNFKLDESSTHSGPAKVTAHHL